MSYKRSSVGSSPRLVVEKNEALLKAALAEVLETSLVPEVEVSFDSVADRIKWHRVSINPTFELLHISGLSPKEVQAWMVREDHQVQRKLLGLEAYNVNLRIQKNETSSPAEDDADEDLLAREIAARAQYDTAVERLFFALFKTINQLDSSKEIPDFVYSRMFYFPPQEDEDPTISSNPTYHIDFFEKKEGEELDTFLSEDAYQYICTVTSEEGPTTIALTNVDEIDLPVVDTPGLERSRVIEVYIEALLAKGLVQHTRLAHNTWYRVDKRLPHRGPRNTDTFFSKEDRVFLHISAISL